jgi:hypothetical protein
MPDDERPTDKQLRIPIVLVVSSAPHVMAAVDAAAARAHLLVTGCAFDDVATVSAEIRPIALVVPDHVLAFDPEAFHALARDVGARVLEVNEETFSVSELEADLRGLTGDFDGATEWSRRRE